MWVPALWSAYGPPPAPLAYSVPVARPGYSWVGGYWYPSGARAGPGVPDTGRDRHMRAPVGSRPAITNITGIADTGAASN